MPQTIDYRLNIDMNEAMSTLQLADMRMSQLGGGYRPLPYQPGPVEQAFGDLSFSAGQFSQRFQAPLGTIQTFTPSALSTMPHVNFATAATAVWNPGGLSVPHGIAAYDFQRHAEEQFAVQGGRAAAGFTWGVGKELGLLGFGAIGAKIGSRFGLLGMGVGAVGGYMLGRTVLAPVSGMLQDRAVIEDVVASSSKMSRSEVRSVASSITDLHLADPQLTASDAATIAGVGAKFGLMGKDPATSSKEYLQNFRELTKNAKEVATALGTSLQEGMATMAQLKGAGFGTGQIGGVISTLSDMAGGDPAKTRGLIGTGMMGASAFYGTGMARTGGFWQALGTSGAVGGAMAAGDVSREMWHQAGGQAGVTRLMLGSNMQFQESGLGVALQAGLWQGGTGMAAYSGGDAFALMSGGLGGMSSGDFLSFNRNRAEAVGGMKPQERMRLEASTHMQMAEMMAGQMGGDVGDALFFMAQNQGMSTPQAQAWASSIQRIASGKGSGGGGSSRTSRIESRVRARYEEQNQRRGIDAIVGGFRDMIDRGYHRILVDPITALQGRIEDKISDYVAHTSSAVADTSIIEMSYERTAGGQNRLTDQMRMMSGMDISEYEFAESFRRRMDDLGVESGFLPGGPSAGWINAGKDKFYYAPSIGAALDEAKATADAAWGTGVAEVRNGRTGKAGDANRVYEDIVRHHGSSAAAIRRVRDAYKKDGFGAASSLLLANSGEKRTAAGLAAVRTFLSTHLNQEVSREDFEDFETRAQLAVAGELGSKEERVRLREAIQIPYETRQRHVGARGPTGPSRTVTRHRPISEAQMDAYGDDIVTYMEDAVTITEAEAKEARALDVKNMTWGLGSPDAFGEFQPTSESALKVSRARATSALIQRGAKAGVLDDPDFLKIAEGLDLQSDKELMAAIQKTSVFYEEHGGPGSMAAGGGGKKAAGKTKTVVPIAMGIDATDRDLYNAVASLYRSVQTLEGSIKNLGAGGDTKGKSAPAAGP